MSKIRTMIKEDDGYNNRRDDCIMLRKEDIIYFNKITILLEVFLYLSFLLLLFII